jgi:hypothetical protein
MEQLFADCFGDKRLEKRAVKMAGDLFRKSVHSIRQISEDYASQRAWYRFLGNSKTSESEIIKDITRRCSSSVKDRIVLSIQDTSEINLYSHRNRIKTDSKIGTNGEFGLGFYIHPSFVVDATNMLPLGFSHIKVWNRPMEQESKRERHYKKLPIEQKESYKWIESSIKTKETLSEAGLVIIVQDREGDIYDQFATIPDAKTELLIRSKSDRHLIEGITLFEKLSQSEIAGNYSIDLPGDKRRKQQKRTATLAIRFCPASIKRSASSTQKKQSVELYAIEAFEIDAKNGEAVNWKILTSIPVTSFAIALMVIEWYSWRWLIEEIFRILKEEGYNIEASELESPSAIRKLCLLMLTTSVKLFQMRYYQSVPEGETTEAILCFNEAEQECLEKQSAKLEGKTGKLKNPFPKKSIAWATWAIARLGGWKGTKSERRPGITTLWVGLRRFYDIYDGWTLPKEMNTLNYTEEMQNNG